MEQNIWFRMKRNILKSWEYETVIIRIKDTNYFDFIWLLSLLIGFDHFDISWN